MKLAAGLTGLLCLANLTAPAPFYPAQAYYSQSNRTEVFTIKPNETAFYVDTKDKEPRTNTLDYLQKHQLQQTEIKIPHSKMWGTGGTSWFTWDYYVPDGYLIRVNRAPFAKSWTQPDDKKAPDESLHCSTQDGLRMSYGVSVSASIETRDAAQYLSYFGVIPPGNPSRPAVAFASELFARPLGDVMQTFGRNKIAAMVCQQIHAHTLKGDSEASPEIMQNVFAEASKEFMSYGITIQFVGWASKFHLDPAITKSINNLEVAERDAMVAKAMSHWIDVLQRQSFTAYIRNFSARTDGHLPRNLQSGPGILDQLLLNYLKRTPNQNVDAAKSSP